jgi:outer membrane cobalamin receptor
MRGGLRAALALLAATSVTACATGRVADHAVPSERDGPIITREEIERSGARDGWEALRLSATHLNFQYTREGSDARVTHRGVQSFLIDPQVLLIVDGTHMQSLSVLETIPARDIDYIQILSARVGVVRYGTSAGNGAVVVKTGVPPPDVP